jgi:hypothetical protein
MKYLECIDTRPMIIVDFVLFGEVVTLEPQGPVMKKETKYLQVKFVRWQ